MRGFCFTTAVLLFCQAVDNMYSRSIQHTIEKEGILAFKLVLAKYPAVYNMDQTAIYIDMNGRTTIEFRLLM